MHAATKPAAPDGCKLRRLPTEIRRSLGGGFGDHLGDYGRGAEPAASNARPYHPSRRSRAGRGSAPPARARALAYTHARCVARSLLLRPSRKGVDDAGPDRRRRPIAAQRRRAGRAIDRSRRKAAARRGAAALTARGDPPDTVSAAPGRGRLEALAARALHADRHRAASGATALARNRSPPAAAPWPRASAAPTAESARLCAFDCVRRRRGRRPDSTRPGPPIRVAARRRAGVRMRT